MNERITKWLKNHLVTSEHTEFGWQDCHRYEFDEDEIKEFTRLIVKECASYMYEHYPHSRYEINYMRKHMGDANWNKHFGDEE
jgi:hypothetical protein